VTTATTATRSRCEYTHDLHVVDEWISMWPCIHSITTQGLYVDPLWAIEVMQCFGEEMHCIIHQRCLCLKNILLYTGRPLKLICMPQWQLTWNSAVWDISCVCTIWNLLLCTEIYYGHYQVLEDGWDERKELVRKLKMKICGKIDVTGEFLSTSLHKTEIMLDDKRVDQG
jgi:hypothetical protein